MKPRLHDLLPHGSRVRAAGLAERIRVLPTSSSRSRARCHLMVRGPNGLTHALANLQTLADGGNERARELLKEIGTALSAEEAAWVRRRAGEDAWWNTWTRIRENVEGNARLRREWKLEWASVWDGDPPDEPEEEIDSFRDWASSTYGVDVDEESGLATFDRRTREVEVLLDGLDVAVYHHTTSKLLSRIRRQGLVVDRARSNPYQNSGAGVYVTTETSGRVIEGYGAAATTRHGGRPVMLTIRTRLHALDDDPDDQELAWARGRQFVLPQVEAGDIVHWGHA